MVSFPGGGILPLKRSRCSTIFTVRGSALGSTSRTTGHILDNTPAPDPPHEVELDVGQAAQRGRQHHQRQAEPHLRARPPTF
jgi:hypothetical protein